MEFTPAFSSLLPAPSCGSSKLSVVYVTAVHSPDWSEWVFEPSALSGKHTWLRRESGLQGFIHIFLLLIFFPGKDTLMNKYSLGNPETLPGFFWGGGAGAD